MLTKLKHFWGINAWHLKWTIYLASCVIFLFLAIIASFHYHDMLFQQACE